MALILSYFAKFGSFWGWLGQWLKIDLYCLQQKCSPRKLVFSSLDFVDICGVYRERVYYLLGHILWMTVSYWPTYIAIMTVHYEIL